jgi:hypothetical protein
MTVYQSKKAVLGILKKGFEGPEPVTVTLTNQGGEPLTMETLMRAVNGMPQPPRAVPFSALYT